MIGKNRPGQSAAKTDCPESGQTKSLPFEARAELPDARSSSHTHDVAKVRAADVGVGIVEVVTVEDVEELGANLELHPLLDFEVLVDGQILAGCTEAVQAGHLRSGVPEVPVGRIGDARGIEVPVVGHKSGIGGIGNELRAVEVTAQISSRSHIRINRRGEAKRPPGRARVPIVRINAERCAGAVVEGCAQRPVADDAIHPATFARQEAAAIAEGQRIKNVSLHDALVVRLDVIARITQVVEILHTCQGDPVFLEVVVRSASLVGEGIAHIRRQAMGSAVNKFGLERIVL